MIISEKIAMEATERRAMTGCMVCAATPAIWAEIRQKPCSTLS